MSSFRPIAPAPASPSPPPPARNSHPFVHMDAYAATCNPPRRAKRARADHDSFSPLTSNPDDDPCDVPQPLQPKRRGRKPGTLSRAAREAQRKINHSLIEKARRTKINDALATLRQLVPADYTKHSCSDELRPQDESDDEQDTPDAGTRSRQHKAKGSGEKEFKLEILVRTVAYLEDLTERAKALERDGCPHCNQPVSLTDSHDNRPDAASTVSPAAPSSTSRLPSISTWLSTLTPSQSPSCDPAKAAPSRAAAHGTSHHHQLPTPPTSATFTPTSNATGIPPALTLPSPSTFLPVRRYPPTFVRAPGSAAASAGAAVGSATPAHGFVAGGNGRSSPATSPVYTPEDESAASLLLRMSTCASSPSMGWFAIEPGAGATGKTAKGDLEGSGRSEARSALTPSRLLGLTKASFQSRRGDVRQP